MTTSIRFRDYNIIHFFGKFVKGFKENFSKFPAVLDNSAEMHYN